MRELILKLTLLEDVIVNERPATEGGHAGLDYLPGILLLGAAAARLYPHWSRETAWRVFHSGEVRFGDALPLRGNLPGWPIPLCWHGKKGDSFKDDEHWLSGTRIRNLQSGRFEDGAQPKQLRDGFVRRDGFHIQVRRSFRMKTAIDPRTGRVAESQLFGYESMEAGQSFVARVQADAGLPEELWSSLVDSLTDSGELLLGRSRSAEYGRTRVEIFDKPPALEPETAPGESSTDRLTLWCLSDLALLDEWGQPTLAPTPQALGLDHGEIDWAHTFLRFRRYAIWNQHRNGYDCERQVIKHGSVITLKDQDKPFTDQERRRLGAGAGLYREAGLGWVSVDPLLLSSASPSFEQRDLVHELKQQKNIARPDHPLIHWLEQGLEGDSQRRNAETEARRLRDEIKRRYELARTYAGVPKNRPIGPSPAQWGTVYERSRLADSGDIENLQQALFSGENAVCKERGEGWQDAFRDDVGVRCFFEWFQSQVGHAGLPSVQAVRLFAREAQRVARREHGQSDKRENAA